MSHNGMTSPAVQKFVQDARALLRAPLVLREDEASSFEWTPGVIAGVVAGSVLLLFVLWILYRYLIWKPQSRARRAGTPSPKAAAAGTAEENRQLIVGGNTNS